MGCHLAGACPQEKLDITPWAEATARWLLRHPYSQRLPRKFKINFSGCATDCGQAMFNDVGVIATTRTLADGTDEAGFQVFVAGGLGANPHPAQALEEFTAREDLLPTIEACLRTFDHYGNRDNKIRARMKWLVDTMGIDELRERIIKERKFLRAARGWPGGIPEQVRVQGDAPAGGVSVAPTGTHQGRSGEAALDQALRPLGRSQRRARRRQGHDQRDGVRPARRHHHRPVPGARRRSSATSSSTCGSPTARTSRSATSPRPTCKGLYDRLAEIGMAEPGAELARDVVACPGADTCNLAVTQSRGLAAAIGDALETAGLAEVPGVRTNISGCTNSCGQHHISDIGFFGLERRAHGRAAPGYQMLLGGHVGDMQIEFGDKASKLPAKSAPEAVVRIVGRFNEERTGRRGLLAAGSPVRVAPRAWARRVEGPRPLPHPRRRPRVLRRLRRDRSVRRRSRRRASART